MSDVTYYFQWKTLLEENTVKAETGESQPCHIKHSADKRNSTKKLGCLSIKTVFTYISIFVYPSDGDVMRELVVWRHSLVADFTEKSQFVLTFDQAQVIDHVQLAELDIVKLFVADVAGEDGDNPTLVVLTGDNLHMVRVPEQFEKGVNTNSCELTLIHHII